MRPHNGPRPGGPRAQVKLKRLGWDDAERMELGPQTQAGRAWRVCLEQYKHPGLSPYVSLAGLPWLLSGCLVCAKLLPQLLGTHWKAWSADGVSVSGPAAWS